jgi:hypothetical protein
MSISHFYQAYGLTFQSDQPVDSLLAVEEQNAQVTINRGRVEDHIGQQIFTTSHANWRAAKDIFSLEIENVAKYLVRNGNEIWIEAAPAASDDDINAFLISSAFAALLQQRRLLTLHASAIMTDRGSVLFVGLSGSGKSTTLAALADMGYEMVTDDIAALGVADDGTAEIIPSFPFARLREDALARLGKSKEDYSRLRSKVEKYIVPMDGFDAAPKPVQRIFLLDINEKPEIDVKPLGFTDAFYWLSYFTFRKRFYDGLQLGDFHFQQLSRLVQSTSVHQICRPDYPYMLDEWIGRIVEEIGAPMIDKIALAID